MLLSASDNWFEGSDRQRQNGTFQRTMKATVQSGCRFTGDSAEFTLVTGTAATGTQQHWWMAWKDSLNFWSAEFMTKTLAYDGFGPGTHLPQIQSQFGDVGVDTIQSPVTVPVEDTSPPTGLVR